MLNQIIFTGIAVIGFSLSSFAQVFQGTVLDANTKTPISYANVYFAELQTGTTTNEQGVFTIERYPKKKIHVQISYIGYKTLYQDLDLAIENKKQFFLQQSHIELYEVVISVPGGKLQTENIVSVERKPLSELHASSSTSLAEAISNIPGIDQNTTGAGIGKPIIRGLSGNRIVTYAQGIRIENQQWGEEHGLGVGEVGIENVEVIKGPASLLYGADALGGVLFFVDERYAKQDKLEGFVESTYLQNSIGLINHAGIKLQKGTFKFNLFGTYSTHSDYEVPEGLRVNNTRFNEQNIKVAIGHNKKYWISNLRYSYLQNHFGITDTALLWDNTKRDELLPFQNVINHNLSFDNTFLTGNSRIKFTLGFTQNNREEFEENSSEAALAMDLSTYTYNFKWHSPTYNDKLDIIIGSQGMYQTNKNGGEEILIPDATTTDFGVFSVATLNLKSLQLQGGVRGDLRNIDTDELIDSENSFPALKKDFSSFNFSAGAMHEKNNNSFRLNIASGFRAPNTSELLSNGVHEGTNRYEIGNQGLKSEKSTQIDFTYQYQNEHISFSINPFYNFVNNYIFLNPTDSVIDGSPVFEYLQNNAALFGGEAGVHYHPHAIHWLHMESYYSSVIAENKDGNALPLIPANKLNTTFKAQLRQNSKWQLKEIYLQHIYAFEQDRIGQFESKSPDYHLLNFGLEIERKTKSHLLTLNTGVKNVLDTEYIAHLSRFKEMNLNNPGLGFYVSVRWQFETKN